MNFRILAASVRPRGRILALLAATALSARCRFAAAQAQTPAAPAPTAHRRPRRPRRPRRRLPPRLRPPAAPAPAQQAPAPRCRRTGGAAAARGSAGSADLRAVDQILPQGPGRQRQAGLLHRQGRPYRVRPAGHRCRDHRAGRRAEEDPARDAAARHAARSRHPRHRRQQRAAAEPLCDLLPERLHVGLRGNARTAWPT